MNGKGRMLLVSALVLSLVLAAVIAPLVSATKDNFTEDKKPLSFGSLATKAVPICTSAACQTANATPAVPGVLSVKSTTAPGQWVYLGSCDGTVSNGQDQGWMYEAPSGTIQTYTYLSWDNSANDLDLYTYDHNLQNAGYSVQGDTDWESVQNTNAYKAPWYFTVYGYYVSGSQSYHVDVWAYVASYDGVSAKTPWSGWWWPQYDNASYEPHLYDNNGPMQKYDTYVVNGGGANPGAMNWEYANHRTTDPNNNWYGHCHAWSAASVIENEPTTAKTKNGVYFEVKDQKGLITESHGNDDFDLNGSRYNGYPGDDINDVYPNVFHKTLVDYIGRDSLPIVIDTYAGVEVWNYPAYRYSMKFDPDLSDPSRTHVTCTVTFAADNVNANYVGTSSFDKTYTYYLIGGTTTPTGGAWEGDSINDHPDFMWYPTAQHVSSGCPLNYNTVKNIIS